MNRFYYKIIKKSINGVVYTRKRELHYGEKPENSTKYYYTYDGIISLHKKIKNNVSIDKASFISLPKRDYFGRRAIIAKREVKCKEIKEESLALSTIKHLNLAELRNFISDSIIDTMEIYYGNQI